MTDERTPIYYNGRLLGDITERRDSRYEAVARNGFRLGTYNDARAAVAALISLTKIGANA